MPEPSTSNCNITIYICERVDEGEITVVYIHTYEQHKLHTFLQKPWVGYFSSEMQYKIGVHGVEELSKWKLSSEKSSLVSREYLFTFFLTFSYFYCSPSYSRCLTMGNHVHKDANGILNRSISNLNRGTNGRGFSPGRTPTSLAVTTRVQVWSVHMHSNVEGFKIITLHLNFQIYLQHFTKIKTWYWLLCIECESKMMFHYIEEVHAIKWFRFPT